MILQIDHCHPELPPSDIRKPAKIKDFNAQAQVTQTFQQLLSLSENRLTKQTIQTLTKQRQLCQKRAYASLDISPLEYLFIIFEDRRSHLGQHAQKMDAIMKQKDRKVLKDLLTQKISIQPKTKSICQLKKQLNQSLEMLDSPEKNLEKSKKERQEKKGTQYFEFRRKSYWNIPSEKTESAKEFIKQLRGQKIKQRMKKEEQLKKDKEQQLIEKQQNKVKKAEEQVKLKQQLYRQFALKKEEKMKDEIEYKKKCQEADSFLGKFRERPPNYIIYSERYRKKQIEEQKQKAQFLQMLKKSKHHSSLSELKEEMKRYQELKNIHRQQRMEEQMLQAHKKLQIREKLKSLYHPKILSKSFNNASLSLDIKQIKQKRLLNMQIYSKKIQTPKVDQQKRQQLLKSIEQLKKKQDHKIRKIQNGEEIAYDPAELDPRKIGLQYLQYVKQMTKQIQRKPAPVQQSKQHKLIDRSLLKSAFYNKKVTISNWKEIMENSHLSSEEKAQKMDNYFKLIEQKRASSLKQLKKADQQRKISLQKMMDHYEVEKAAAKLALLRNLT